MNRPIGTLIGLGFAAFWLWIGAGALPTPWHAVTLGFGILALTTIFFRRVTRSFPPSGGQFHRRRFAVTVVAEIIGALLVSWWLDRTALQAYALPALGIVVALHFIGLWWATSDRRFVMLTGTMLLPNLTALFLPVGGRAMLAVSGLGSCAALAHAVGRRR